MRVLNGALLIAALSLISGTACAAKAQPVVYPKELQGVWDLGPRSCKLPVNPDADSPIRVEGKRLVGYEHQETPVSIRRVSMSPLAWVVSATSDNAPGIKTDDLYIVKGDHLTISDGETTKQYRRCR
jgi:hypothetical protein